MRDLSLRKQLKEFGSGGALSSKSERAKAISKKIGKLPSTTKEGLIKGTGIKQKPTKKSSTSMRATSRKLKGAKAISKKMQK